MGAVSPSAIRRFNIGNASLVQAVFTSVDDGDTWASGLTGVLGQLFGQTDNPSTQASAGISVAESSGTFTFYPGEDGAAGSLFILHR